MKLAADQRLLMTWQNDSSNYSNPTSTQATVMVWSMGMLLACQLDVSRQAHLEGDPKGGYSNAPTSHLHECVVTQKLVESGCFSGCRLSCTERSERFKHVRLMNQIEAIRAD